MKDKRFLGFIIIAMLSLGFAWQREVPSPLSPLATAAQENQADINISAPILTEKRKQHILYGDHTGGGHLYGQKKACKSEFPKSWSEDKIISTVKTMAANDHAAWRQSNRNGNWVSHHEKEGLRIRIVLDDERREIITAYPINVKRNPCPAANDNFKD
jgi:hypothetical protein